MFTILVTGATGVLGHYVVSELRARGYRARALCRRPSGLGSGVDVRIGDLRRASSLRGLCDGANAVISCAGASMTLGRWLERSSFAAVDREGNRRLIAEAQRAGVAKYVYVSLAEGPALRHTAYAAAHEDVVDALDASGLAYTVLRPTGFFQFFSEILKMVRRGRAMVVGAGDARTNPIDAGDVARACVDALTNDIVDVPVGGPDTFTRTEIVELACEVAGRHVPIRHLSPRVVKAAIAPMRLLQPRIYALMEFGIEVGLIDVIAPVAGDRRLANYFRSIGQ